MTSEKYELLGRTYNDQLRAIDRDKALRNILDIHEKRYKHVIVSDTLCTLAFECVNKASELRLKRNKIAHYLWSCWSGEKVFGTRRTAALPMDGKENRHSLLLSNDELQEYGTEAHQLVEALQNLLPLLPSKDEDDVLAENKAKE